MLISLSTGSLYVYPLRWTFSLAKRAGFDGIELVIGPEVDWRGAGYIRRLVQEFQLPVLTVHPPLYGYRGWNDINVTYAPYMEKALALTQAVGAGLMVVHPPRALHCEQGRGQEFVARFAASRHAMNEHGTKLGLENGAKFNARDNNYMLRALSELRDFVEKHDAAMTLDTAHLGTFDLDLLDSLEFFDGRLANVHLSDLRTVPHWLMNQPRLHSYYRQHQFPGTGTLPLRELLGELKQRGYDGVITYELSPLAVHALTPWRVERKLREAVQFVRQAIE